MDRLYDKGVGIVSDTKVTCPDCGQESPMPVDGLPDGYYTEICVNCLGTIPYDIINGVIMPWSPPKNVNVQWKGAGEPGGS